MNSNSEPEIYFHVGTGKTGTTFLQYRVFPYLRGIKYIQRTKYKNSKKILAKAHHSRYLISREFDQQLEREVKWFSESYRDTKPIIVFRKHDSYIASQYRRFVKNGFTDGFKKFFDLKNDTGHFKKQDLNYMHQIEILEKYFTQKPLVLIYEDMRNSPEDFVQYLTKKIDATIDLSKVNFNRKHTSYSQKQLKAMLVMGKRINLRKRRVFKNSILHFLWQKYIGAIRYSTLYISKLIPESKFSDQALIDKKELDDIKEYYKQDWEKCLDYAKQNN